MSSVCSRAREPGRSLMFCGHIDTVGVDGMRAPFDPVERDGRLYGRGSQDMKGGVAAMIDAARRSRASRGFDAGRLVVAAVVDEEYASIGADALVEAWRADAAVVTEPTDLADRRRAQGIRVGGDRDRGRAAHGSRPADGRDAILRMGRVLQRLEAARSRAAGAPPHPLMGTGSLHASIIEGGRELSSYPDRCVLHMERRTIAGETGDTLHEEIAGALCDAACAKIRSSMRRRALIVHASGVRNRRGPRAARGADARRGGAWRQRHVRSA